MKEPYLIILKNKRSCYHAHLKLIEKSLTELQAKCDLLSDLIAEIESEDFDVERIKPAPFDVERIKPESSSTPSST